MKQTFKFLLMMLLISDLYSQDVPEVEIDDGFVVDYGDTFTINCSISATHQITTVYWQKDSNGILSRLEKGLAGTKGIDIDNPSLTINFASMTDSGIYTCIASTSFGLGKSKAANITVHGGLPVINTPQTNFTVIYGNSITMECKVTAFPKLKHVNWQRNISGILTILNDGAVGTGGISTDNPSLTLKYTSLADPGIYQCSASNAVGTERSDAMYLTVIGGIPMVTIPLANYSSDYGNEVTIECTVTAIPDVIKIFWEKSVSGEISSINARTLGIEGSIVKNPSLLILNATLTDSGYYTCFAENKVGTGMSRTTYLNVHGGRPDVRIGALVYNAIFGSKLYLHCDVTAKPEHTLVYWERKRNGLISTINFHAIGTTGITPTTPSLTLQYSTFSDIGTYTCVAVNAIGIGKSHQTIVTISGGLPVSTIQKRQYMANYGDTLTIQCNVTSIPTHTQLYWQKTFEGSITNITAEYQGISGANLTYPSLTIESVTTSDAGLYKCIPVNAIGIGHSSECNVTIIADIPSVVIEKNMQTAFVGLSFEIQCSIQSIPLYTYVYWTRSNGANITLIIPGTVGYEGMTAQNPNLFIPKVDIFMGGEYSCIATNEIGTGYSLATNLTVEYNNDVLDVSTTNYETIQREGTTVSDILSTSNTEEETLGHETSATANTEFSIGVTTDKIYVTETEGIDNLDNSSNLYTDNEDDGSGNITGKVAGIVIGTLLCLHCFVALLVGLWIIYKKYMKRKRFSRHAKSYDHDGTELEENENASQSNSCPLPSENMGYTYSQPSGLQYDQRNWNHSYGNDLSLSVARSSDEEDTPSSSSQSESEDGNDNTFDSRIWCSNCFSLHSPPLCENNPSSSSQLESNDGNDYTLNTRYSYVRCPLCSNLHLSSEKCDCDNYGCSFN